MGSREIFLDNPVSDLTLLLVGLDGLEDALVHAACKNSIYINIPTVFNFKDSRFASPWF